MQQYNLHEYEGIFSNLVLENNPVKPIYVVSILWEEGMFDGPLKAFRNELKAREFVLELLDSCTHIPSLKKLRMEQQINWTEDSIAYGVSMWIPYNARNYAGPIYFVLDLE